VLSTEIIFIVSYQFTKNPLRTILSISGIMIGISTLLMMTILNDGMQKQMLEKMEKNGGANLIKIQPETESFRSTKNFRDNGKYEYKEYSNHPITLDMIEKLSKKLEKTIIPVERIARRFKFRKNLRYRPVVIGTTTKYINNPYYQIVKGRFLTDQDLVNKKHVVIVNEKFSEEYFKNKNVLGKYIDINDLQMQIVGISNSEYNFVIPLSTALKKIESKNEIDEIQIYASNFEEVNPLVLQIKALLDEIAGSEKYYKIRVPRDYVEEMFEAKESFSRLLTIITIICLVVGGIGVMNTMLSSVNERIREIGILKSVGAKNREVLKQFISESFLICLIGGIMGIFLGIFAGEAAAGMLVQESYLKNIEAAVSLKSILIAVGFTTLVGIVFGIYPAIKAAKINPVDALRYE
jgi:ABC-type antimicrobial peptide transport system permease subunit